RSNEALNSAFFSRIIDLPSSCLKVPLLRLAAMWGPAPRYKQRFQRPDRAALTISLTKPPCPEGQHAHSEKLPRARVEMHPNGRGVSTGGTAQKICGYGGALDSPRR